MKQQKAKARLKWRVGNGRALGNEEERQIYTTEALGMLRDWIADWRAVARASLTTEILAGLTVAAVALPLNLALASASGLPASAGLIAGAVGGMLAAAFGGAPLCVTGPAAALNVMVLAIVGDFGVEGAAAAALIVGGLQVLLGLTFAGKLTKHVPESVLAGFTTGVGIKLLDNQIPELLGFDYTVVDLAQMMHRPVWLHEVSWLALISGLFVAFLVVTTSQWKRFPAALVGVAAVTALAVYLRWDVERVGEVPSRIPPLSLPAIPDERWLELASRAVPLGLLASVESLLCARAVERMAPKEKKPNLNLELVGQGVANVGVGLLAGMPVSAVFVRTGVNVQSGARTRLSSFVHGAALLFAMVVMSQQISVIPLAALAGLLIVVGVRLVEATTFAHLVRTDKAEAAAFLVAAVGTLTGHLMLGLVGGLAIHFVSRYATRGARATAEREKGERERGIRAVLGAEKSEARKPEGYATPPPAHGWLRHLRERSHVAKTAYVHEKASVIGRVVLGEHVHIAAGSSVRADEGTPFFIGASSNIQDGVVLHALKEKHVRVAGEDWAIYVGKNVSMAHQALVHGPCYVGDHTFIGFKAVVHDSIVGEHCFIGIGAIVVGVEVPAHRFVPHGAVVTTAEAVEALPHVSHAQNEFNEDVVDVNRGLAAAYQLASCCSGHRELPTPRTEESKTPERHDGAPEFWSQTLTPHRGERF